VRFFIVLYLTIVFVVSTITANVPYLPAAGVNMTNIGNINESIERQAASFQGNIKPKEFTDVVKSQLSDFINTIVIMATFSFAINGAPVIVNVLLSGLFGILSILFFLALLREVKNLVPWG